MGCSSSTTKENYLPYMLKRRNIQEMNKKYNLNHENFDTIMLDQNVKNSFFQESENLEFSNFFEKFYGKYKIKFDRFNISYAEVKDVILEKLTESQIKECFSFREFNVTEILTEIIEDQPELNEDKIEIAQKFLLSTNRFFPAKQKGCLVAIDEYFEQIGKWGLKNYLTNLKFNAGFQMEVFNIILSNFIFKDEDNIYDLCEVIDSNPNLITLSIMMANFKEEHDPNEKIYQNYIPEQKHLSQLSYLIKAVNNHSNISVFSFTNVRYYMYSLPKETYTALLELISSDKLMGLLLIKINLTQDFIRELIRILPTLSNLKFFMLDCKNLTLEFISELKFAMIKNKKIIGCLLSIGDLEINKEELENEMKSLNPLIKFFECIKEFKFAN